MCVYIHITMHVYIRSGQTQDIIDNKPNVEIE